MWRDTLHCDTTGTLVGNPFELLKVRMQGGDYAYRGVFHGLYTVCRDEGLRTLWNGTPASIIRSSLFSAAQLATYDHTKVTLMKHTRLEPGLQLNFSAAMIAGLVTTTVTTPADFVKSVMMNDAGRRGSDVGMRVIVSKVVRKDGGRSFFRGWLANYARLGPHTVITMLTMEKLRSLIGWDTL